ncbi:MAG: class I SAM-dependent rRNA methyltransferase [Polaromonas sp.]|jgi:23S rRNA (cytosine1962-C5)-methyltransferase
MNSLRLKPGKEKSLLRRHPWVFDGAIATGSGDAGETMRIESADGRFLAWAAYSPQSKIRARVWSFDEAQRMDDSFFRAACARAINARSLFDIQSNGLRLIHGESDGLPGLVVDRYDDTLVAQFSSCGSERFKGVIVDALLKLTGLTRLYERSDASVRSLEGLPEATGWLAGGGSTEVILTEHDWKLSLDVASGHKTGFYLDQRDSRHKFSQYTRRMAFKRVLNCYSYTGGFTVAALSGGAAHVTSIDSSGPAIERAVANVALNGFDARGTTMMDADVNAALRQFLKDGVRFDAIVLDPPKFAPTAFHAERAARAYKDINRLALMLLEPGGALFTYSCSGGISADLFHKIVAGAGLDAGVDAYITERMGGAPDHPMTVTFPEGEYLKGMVLVKMRA